MILEARDFPLENDSIQPRFTHDCDACTFRGHGQDGQDDLDLYVCLRETGNGSVLGRYGHEGHEYISYPVFDFMVLSVCSPWVYQAIMGTRIKLL